MRWSAIGIVGVVSLVLPARPAAAEAPPVLCLGEDTTSGLLSLAVVTAAGDRKPLLEDMPSAIYDLTVHAATGRWAMSFNQLSNGDPLKIGGKAVSKAGDRSTLVFGTLDGVTASVYGDPKCSEKERSCYELTRSFSPDGKYVFIDAESSRYQLLSRWSFGAKPKREAVTDGKHGGVAFTPGGKHAAYLGNDGVHVVAWPAQKKKAAKIKLSKKAVVAPDLLMSDAWAIGERLYWFRREPVEQKRGYYEAYDLATKQTVVLREAAADFPMMDGEFLSTGPRDTVLFGDTVGFERLDVLEVGSGGDVAQVIAHDVRRLLDVSPDGRYLLATRRDDPSKGETGTNPERLVIIDLETHEDVAVLDAGGKVHDAGFVH